MSLARLLRTVELPADPEVLPQVAETAATRAAAVLAGIRRPAAVQAAQAALDAARDEQQAAAASLAALIAARQVARVPSTEKEVLSASAAVDAAKQTVRARKADLRDAVEAWTSSLLRLLSPCRAAAAQRIVDAVDAIQEALAEIAPFDRFAERWAIEPHPPLQLHDLRALRFSAERIVVVNG